MKEKNTLFGVLWMLVVLSTSTYAQQGDSTKNLDEVVVTALGVQRLSKTLTYATQEIKSGDLTSVRETNPMNSLNGRVAGLQLYRNSSGAGGSVKITLRGNKSTRDNSPLYVIDGLPIDNNLGAQTGSVFGQVANSGSAPSSGRDGGDVLSNLNPDDIESITVLKGATAAALYGSQAANGAILITTKSGKSGRTSVVYSTSLTFESPFVMPELQNSYVSLAGSKYSWGPKSSSPNVVKDFYNTGTNWTNNITVAGGNEKNQTYFSYSNTQAKGILPGNDYVKHTVMFKEVAKVGEKITINGNVMLALQNNKGQPTSGLYVNPLTGLYLFPRGLNFSLYDGNNYEVYSSIRSLMRQNWWNINSDDGQSGDDNQQNPYWIINRIPNENNTQRIYSALQIKYQIVDNLSFQLRGNVDKTFSKYEQKSYATSQATLSNSNGRYILNKNEYTQYYTDALFNFNKKWSDDISMTAILGGSYKYNVAESENFDSYGSDLQFANIFLLQNIKQGAAIISQSIPSRKALGAVFANVQLGYKNYITLDLTGRNDFSSTLPGKSFFYPSIGASVMLSDMFRFPDFINFLKIRASYTEVGNDIPAFANNPLNTLTSATGLSQNTIGPKPGTTLSPERSKAIELGIEMRLFKNVLDIAVTEYKNNTYDQYMLISAPVGSGFTQYAINAGNIQNMGYEVVFNLHPFIMSSNPLKWDITLNASQNFNEVVKLSDELSSKQVILTEAGVNNYAYYIEEGQSYGSIYGKKFARDAAGRIKLDASGKPTGESNLSLLGNSNPDALLGLTNTFTYKGFTLSFLVDARIGGKVLSMTEAILSEYGVSKQTADARNAGGVRGNFVTDGGVATSTVDAEKFYTSVGGRAGITEAFVYSATNVRLRQLSLGYAFPKETLAKTKVIKSLNVNFIARNLFFIYKDAPYDPEIAMSSGTGLQGVDAFSIPSTTSLGFSLSIGF